MATKLTATATVTANGTSAVDLSAEAIGGLLFEVACDSGVTAVTVQLHHRIKAAAPMTPIAEITLPLPTGELGAGFKNGMVSIPSVLGLDFDAIVTGYTGTGNVYIDLLGVGL